MRVYEGETELYVCNEMFNCFPGSLMTSLRLPRRRCEVIVPRCYWWRVWGSLKISSVWRRRAWLRLRLAFLRVESSGELWTLSSPSLIWFGALFDFFFFLFVFFIYNFLIETCLRFGISRCKSIRICNYRIVYCYLIVLIYQFIGIIAPNITNHLISS